MSAKSDYNNFLQRREKALAHPMSDVFFQQERRYVKPFKIFGNVYYVGDSWVCVHLIDTGDGLLLIDSGNTGATAMLIHAIWELGFRPQDVKWMIISHGHVDHIGGAIFFRNMFDTKLYLGKPDANMFASHPEFAFIQDSPNVADSLFTPDVCIEDGDVIEFGDVKIECLLVPGHTKGCVALFFDAVDTGRILHCGYYGGFGFNTLSCSSLDEIGDTGYEMWKIYENSIDKVIDRNVDIFLGNHTVDNQLMKKYRQMERFPQTSPFIDAAEWARYLGQKKEELREFVRKEYIKAENEKR